jgi:hypothetical protein
MLTSSVKELKNGLKNIPQEHLVELCLQLVKYKKENKELLSYLLFQVHDEDGYIAEVKAIIDGEFSGISKKSAFHGRKAVRKALRITNKYIKYSKLKTTEVELLIYFCKKLRKAGISLNDSNAMGALYLRQVAKVKKTVASMHEDLQSDYEQDIQHLQI